MIISEQRKKMLEAKVRAWEEMYKTGGSYREDTLNATKSHLM